MRRRSLFARSSALIAVVALIGAVLVVGAAAAGASSGPYTPATVTVHQAPHVICRAYGGSISANTEADQDLGFDVTYPDGVHAGDTFTIKIRPDVSLYPRTDTSSGTTATIVNIYNQVSGYQLPAGLTINSASIGPVDGNVEANADAGYYVNKANVPHSVVSGVGDIPDPNFDPMTLSPSLRLAIPGTAPNAYWNTTTNRVYGTALGTGANNGEFAGGSALQQPTLFVNVTAKMNIAAGTHLGVTLAGQLPSGSFTGAQPGNFPAPSSSATLTSTPAAAPWGSTNGTRYAYSDSVWSDPTYLNTVYTTALGGIIQVTAKATCAPGWEATGAFPTAPSYYTGPNAIPNGTSPPLTDSALVGIGSTAPFDNAIYPTGASIPAAYACIANPQNEPYDTCTGDVANGSPFDTSTTGPHTFTINATDAYQSPVTRVINYTVADPLAPVASAGGNQTGKAAGTVITLDGSGTTDPNGPPALPLTYTWAQTGGPSVTLSDVHAVKPTFTVPAVTTPSGDTFQFSLTVNNGFLQNTANTTVTSAASTPTVTVSKARAGGGTTFSTGDDVTLTANITNPDGTNPADYSYAWSQTGGRTTALSPSNGANPTYRVPSSGANPTTAACTSGTGSVSATSANCPTFSVIVTKTNTGKVSIIAALPAYASSLPTRPVANAGAAQNVANAGGTTVTLDGSGSTQAQGHVISYAWSQTGGPAVTLSSNTVQKPTFTAPAGGSTGQTLTFSLTVTDTQSPITGTGTNGNTSTAATTTVTIVPDHVVATASANPTTGVAGTVVTLNGSASTDPNLAPLSYTWAQVSNGAPSITLSNPSAVAPTFTAPPATAPAGYVAQFNLTATNGGPNPADTGTTVTPVSVTIAASTPTASVTRTPSGTVFSGDTITLGATITNPDGNNPADYSYAWSQASGIATSLSSTTAANPTFVLPANGTSACASGTGATNCPRFQVVVTKSNTNKASGAASLANYGSTAPTRPVANAGTAQGVKVGASVQLDGSASTQAQGHTVTYAWSQTAGTTVSLSSTTAQKPTFTAPITAGSLTFSLIVTDPQNPITSGTNSKTSAANTVTITVSNYASPVASAGSDQSVVVGTTGVTLDASGSSQADNHTLTYQWTQTAGPAVTLSNATAVQPTFTAPNAGATLKFTVTVTDTQNPNPAAASTTSGAVTVTVNDYASPVASAGTDQTVNGGTTGVTLDASGSSQADNHTLTYQWTQIAGPAVTLSDATAVQPTFTAPNVAGALQFAVTVTDTQNPNPATASSTSGQVAVTVIDFASPIVSAGSSQSVHVGDGVTLHGSASQADDHTLSYQWTQTAGPAVTLSDSTVLEPTFTAPNTAAVFSFNLTATDTQNPDPATATGVSSDVTITVNDYAAPFADAGSDQTVPGATLVTLDASGSSQADEHALSYHWIQTAGPVVTLSNAFAVQPTFTAPSGDTSLEFTVTVTDTQNPNPAVASSTSAPVTVAISNFARPIASAGSNQSVHVADPVALDASGSSQADAHTLTYLWAQTAGTAVVLSSTSAVQPTFTAPNAGTTLKFTVTVTDTENPNPAAASATSSAVTITVNDYASPVVSAGADQSVQVGDPVGLAGSASQADNHALTYHWTQTAGPAVTLSSSTVLSPTFTAPASATTIKFTLTATDTQNPNPALASTTSSAVTVTVTAAPPTGPAASVGDVTVVEGNTSSRKVAFRVTLSQPASAQVTVNYTVTGDSATVAAKKGAVDVTAKTSGALIFKVGATGKTPVMKSIAATIWGNTANDGNRNFHVTITSVVGGAVPGRTVGFGTIVDDDSGPSGLTVGVGDAAVVEGNSGTRSMIIPVTLSDVPTGAASVTFTVAPASATWGRNAKVVGADFGGKQSGTLTWTTGGSRTKNVTIPVFPDTTDEGISESFTVTIATPSGVSIFKATGTGTIIDDD